MIKRLAAAGVGKDKIAEFAKVSHRRVNQIIAGEEEISREQNINSISPAAEIESLQRKLDEAEAARRSTEQRLSAVQSDLKLAKMALDRSSYPGIPEHSLPV